MMKPAGSGGASSAAAPARLRPSPLSLMTIKAIESGSSANRSSYPSESASSASGKTLSSKKRVDLEAMEHAFLDLDEMEDPSADEWDYQRVEHPDKMLRSLNELRKEQCFCDVTIRAGDRDFPVHKCVISAVSNYFKAMFSSGLCEAAQDTVSINGVHPSILEQLFDYAYTSEIKITKSTVQNLLAAANLLEILPVRDACCLYLDKHMDAHNSLGIQNFAEMHACTELQSKARKFSLKRFAEIVQGEEFLTISQSQLIDLISSDDLEVDREEAVFEAVMRWLTFAKETREPEFHRVLAHVRLPLMSPYYLHDVMLRSSSLLQSKECQRLLEEARLFHLLPDRRTNLNQERTRTRCSAGLMESIVCVGGEDDKVVLRSVDSYDPDTNQWKQLPCLPFAVSKHGLVVSGTNQLYMAGGEYPDGSASKAVWRYEPLIDVWQELAHMTTPRSELGLALLDGFIYAIGGWEGSARLDSVERYEISKNKWTPVSNMKLAVTSPAVVAHDGFVYVCGGAILEDGDGIDVVQRFDTKTEEWKELAPMLIPRSGSGATILNGSIYVIGGWHASTENTNKVEKYDFRSNTWTYVCPMHDRRYRPGVSVLGGKLYVLGGEEGWDRYHESVEVYDPVKDRWDKKGNMPSPRSWLSCVPLKVKSDTLSDTS